MTKRIHDKLDKIDERLQVISEVLVKNTTSLDYHIKRTDLLEEEVNILKRLVSMFIGALKFITLLSIVIGIVLALKQVM